MVLTASVRRQVSPDAEEPRVVNALERIAREVEGNLSPP